MLSLHRYLEVRRRIDRQAVWIVAILLGAIALTYAAIFGIAGWLGPTPQQNSPAWRDWLRAPLIMGGGLSPLAIAIAIMARFATRPRDIPEFECPGCRTLMLDNSGIIVATGKCPACLSHVVKLDKPIPRSGPLLTLAELQRVMRSQFRALALSLLWLMFGPLAFLMVAFAFALLAPDLATGGEAASWLGPLILVVTPFGGLMLATVLYSWRMMVRCPSCRMLISATSTIITSGNCPRCASPIVKDATPWSEYRHCRNSLKWKLREAITPRECLPGCSGAQHSARFCWLPVTA